MERDGVDWAQCYREGMPMPMGGAGFVVPLSAQQDLVVLMVPVAKHATAQAREQLGRSLQLMHQGRSLWQSLREVLR